LSAYQDAKKVEKALTSPENYYAYLLLLISLKII